MKLLFLVCIIALAEGRRHPTLRRLEKPCRSEKKCRNCEGRCVKEETVQCLRDPCEDSPCGDKEMCVANYCGECSACCLKPKKCNKRSKMCKDGSEIFRDPFNNCKYPKCPEPVICTNDVFECADGTYLTRGGPNCEFPECPVPACAPKDSTTFFDPKTCQVIRFQCEEGFEYWGNPDCGCGCKPKVEGCPEDAFICPDGTSLSRDPANNCEFPKCPVPACAPEGAIFMRNHETCMLIDFICQHDFKTCQAVRFECKDGFEYWSKADCGCGCKPKVEGCPEDAFFCPNGAFLSRDPANNCEFPKCPPTVPKCAPRGTTNYRDFKICQVLGLECKDGFELWSKADCGCGCKPKIPACAPKGSTFYDPRTCEISLIHCEEGFEYWSNTPDCGCGCKPKIEG